jgi:beta-lactamase regulating signal transducer with metallopeptidase domain
MTQWLISSSALILAVVALRYALRGRISLRLQYALWALVLLRLLVPLSFGESAVSVMNAAEKLPLVSDSQRISGMDSIAYRTSGDVLGYYTSDFMNDFPTVIASDQSRQDFARMKGVLDFRQLFVRVWIAGAFLLALVFLVSNFSFAQRLKKSRVYCEVRGSLLPVYVAQGLLSPCLYGLLRPAIYVTPELLMDEGRLRHVLAHETTHFRHGDNLWSFLRCLCLCLHWFNPLVWLAASLSRRDAELACDEGTIKRLGEAVRAEYGRTLIGLTCEKRSPGALFLSATTMLGGKKSIKERITLIAKKPKTALWALVAVVLAVALVAGCSFTGSKAGPDGSTARDLAVNVGASMPQTVLEAAESYAGGAFAMDTETENAPGYTRWRIEALDWVYSYALADETRLDIYCFNYEYFAEHPENVVLAGGMYVTEAGWVCPTYPNCHFIVYDPDKDKVLLTLFENDCAPGSKLFTDDMQLLLSQRGVELELVTGLTAEQLELLKSTDWWQYRQDNGGEAVLERIAELREAVEGMPQISEDDCASLMKATIGLYGAYAHAYGELLFVLYSRHGEVYAKCFAELDFGRRAKVTELRLSADPQLDTASLGFENIVFDDAELDAAFDCARAAFDGKTRRLENLWYSHYRCAAMRESYLRNGRGGVNGVEPENVLVLFCDYTLLEAPGREEQFFTDWMLILIRDDADSPWRIDDQGY